MFTYTITNRRLSQERYSLEERKWTERTNGFKKVRTAGLFHELLKMTERQVFFVNGAKKDWTTNPFREWFKRPEPQVLSVNGSKRPGPEVLFVRQVPLVNGSERPGREWFKKARTAGPFREWSAAQTAGTVRCAPKRLGKFNIYRESLHCRKEI